MPTQRLKTLASVVLFALLFYLSFSKLNLWFFIFPALWLLAKFRHFYLWLAGGFLAFFMSLWWIRIAMIDYGDVVPLVAYSLIALLVLFLALIQFGGTYLLWRYTGYRIYLLPFAWVLMEVLRSLVPYGGFPWLILGELSVDMPLVKLYLTAGGVYLGSLLIMFISLLPYLLRDRLRAVILILIFLLPLPFLKREYTTPPQGISVAVVQTNVEESIKLDKKRFYEYLPRMWSLLEQVIEHKPDIVFLPESAFPFTANTLHSEGKRLLEYSYKSAIVTGLIDIRFMDGWSPHNSVFVIHEGKVRDFYDKVRLLPFGEYVPFPFGFVKEIFGAVAGMDYVPGQEHRCLEVKGVKVATPVCFEVSYYNVLRDFSRCANLVAVLTNDGWFRDSDGTFQHLRQARVRAVENRLFLLWVNNTGPSAVISPEGSILKEIPYGEEGFLLYSF